jgi:predicted SnoaL-like aldol condensation-catalyzing enzyme
VSNEENFALVRRFNQVLRTENDLTILDELLAPDFVAHAGDVEVHGPEGWRQFVLETRSQGGEIETGTDELLGDGELVAERWWVRSTADGKGAVRGHGITMHRIVNGKLQEDWAVFQPDS